MPDASTITPIRSLEEAAALDWLRSQPDGRTKLSAAELGRRWGWHRQRAGRRIKAWQKSGVVTRRGNTVAAVVESVPAAVPKAATRPVHVTRQVTPAITPSAGLDAAAYLAAVGLAAVAA